MTPSLPRLPVSVLTSLGLHAGAFAAYLYVAQASRIQNMRVISNVDLLIQVRKPVALPKPIAQSASPPSTWNFLKMALPAVPKTEPQRLEVKAPQARRTALLQEPKLEDKKPPAAAPKVAPLDLSEKRADLAKIDSGVEPRRSAAALAALPRLEEVGRRRVRNLPEALALEEKRQEAVSLKRMSAITAQTHRHIAPAMELLHEAPPSASARLKEKIASILPAAAPPVEMLPEMREAPDTLKKQQFVAPAPEARKSAEAMSEEKKKGVEIEGPISDRKVLTYDIPEFPAWAKDQGVLEASVAIRFWVSREGDVLPNMRVERTSGYGRLDRLASEALRNWKFVPILAEEKQWGVITFRFVME